MPLAGPLVFSLKTAEIAVFFGPAGRAQRPRMKKPLSQCEEGLLVIAGDYIRLSEFRPAPIGATTALGDLAEFVERGDQVMCDQLRGTAFDLVPLDHMHQLPILKKGDGRRRRRVRQ